MNGKVKCVIEKERLLSIKRCKRCLLPVTFPLIDLDENGVCGYCRNYERWIYLGRKALEQKIFSSLESGNKGKYDCIVPLSGGRDSSWVLHYLKKEMGLSPVAVTYDWGMVTPLAHKNIKTMCNALGIPNVVIDPGTARKKNYIRKNVLAWLEKPSLSTVTLFMVGDKGIYFHLDKIRRKYNAPMIFWGQNHFERTDFKAAFLNVDEKNAKRDYIRLGTFNKFKLAAQFIKEMIKNPRFINSSLFDSFLGFFGFFFVPKNYINLFDYVIWDEETVNKTLIEEYGWEKEPDYTSTWRIGDGTSAFYNYIYARVAGFSEIDTFRSNQVREGVLSREKALEMTVRENMPREDSIRWYLNAIGVDFNNTVEKINSISFLDKR
jgi:glucosamine--fructose-6-phosphate aminotransferase (isomerizing)